MTERGQAQVAEYRACEGHTAVLDWKQYGITANCPQREEMSGRYIAVFPRYARAPTRDFLVAVEREGVQPAFQHAHILPQRLYEYRAAQGLLLKSLDYMPILGDRLRGIREKVVGVNERRKVKLYDLANPRVRRILDEVIAGTDVAM